MIDLWDRTWQECYDEAKGRSPEYDPDEYYRSGRASKQWPDKEGPEWWQVNGPKFVKTWVSWRDACGLEFAEFPDSDGVLQPAIEVELWAYGPDNLSVKSVIDRVMTDGTDLYIIDLKTGYSTQPWPLQLALNNLCLRYTMEESAKYGGFWKARRGSVEKWFDLSIYSDDWLWEQVWKAREIRDRQLFIPNPNNLCNSACGVKQFCRAMGGDPSLYQTDATVTQNNNEGESK